MAKYKCSICGYIYDEEKEGKPFSELKDCPICHQPLDKFVLLENENKETVLKTTSLEYPKELARQDTSCRYMKKQ